MLASLLIAAAGTAADGLARPAAAAEELSVRLDGLEIPINLAQLETWSRDGRLPDPGTSDLGVWLGLLEPGSRADLIQLLRAPLLRDRSFGRQLLDSWAGGQLLAKIGELLTTPEGASTTPYLQTTLRQLLEQRREVTSIELLRALPPQRLSLQLDGLLLLADQWRQQLQLQQRALRRLQDLGLPLRRSRVLSVADGRSISTPVRLQLRVPHRSVPLPLEIWPAPAGSGADRHPWLLLMPGLGGTAEQLGWLARSLAERGWPAVVLQHPGSDAAALRASLEGRRPPPGAETLGERLADVRAVLAARQAGSLPVEGDGVVLVGHSLGGLTALLAAGLHPEPGLPERCRRAFERVPLTTNPSRLLQCQLPSAGLPAPASPPSDLRGVVVFNGFGSMLWPRNGLRPLGVPVLLVGGSLDLVTPPLQEQLALFQQPRDLRSRLVLVDGGSHFSPVRMSPREEVLFRLGSDLVGVEPATVQALLLRLTGEFLQTLLEPLQLPPQQRSQEGVRAYVLDATTARRWRAATGP